MKVNDILIKHEKVYVPRSWEMKWETVWGTVKEESDWWEMKWGTDQEAPTH